MRGDEQSLMAESGADGYLSKPITDHAAFVEQVKRTIGEEAA
jgi:CheY-like chemotaxis protein